MAFRNMRYDSQSIINSFILANHEKTCQQNNRGSPKKSIIIDDSELSIKLAHRG